MFTSFTHPLLESRGGAVVIPSIVLNAEDCNSYVCIKHNSDKSILHSKTLTVLNKIKIVIRQKLEQSDFIKNTAQYTILVCEQAVGPCDSFSV